ncbi:MAG TPA: hypothetical protein VG253_06075, partial [Streptosporangiaceae bacterium]|nr:hypothetical protein [Streptosporangiaceae bacterium]
WQLYVHDLSEFRGSMPGSDGLYQRTRLHAHMNDPDRHGYLISAGPSPAGPVRAGPVRAGPSPAGLVRAGPSPAGLVRAGPSPAGLVRAGLVRAGLVPAGPVPAGPVPGGPTPAGFAFVRGQSGDQRIMAEFFVVRAARRRRVGHSAALQILRLHPGRWEIPFQEENAGAARFWRRVAVAAVGDQWTQERRAVPGKPQLPPDTWLLLSV